MKWPAAGMAGGCERVIRNGWHRADHSNLITAGVVIYLRTARIQGVDSTGPELAAILSTTAEQPQLFHVRFGMEMP
jgi:hypothetical protein